MSLQDPLSLHNQKLLATMVDIMTKITINFFMAFSFVVFAKVAGNSHSSNSNCYKT